ncbi:MAG: tyrosine-type recombinase/integrase [Pseudomonadota bacterium]
MHKLIDDWKKIIKTKYCDNTVLAYYKDINRFVEFYKLYYGCDFDPRKGIDLKMLRSWLTYLKTKLSVSNQSVCRMISSVKNFLNYIYDFHKIECIESIQMLRNPKFVKKIIRDIDADKLLNLLNNLPEDNWLNLRNKTLLYLLYSTGIRIAEALSLKRSNISNDICTVLGKGGKYREVFLLPVVVELLKNYCDSLEHEIKEEDYIFIGVKGKVLQAAVARKYLQNLRREHGFPEYLSPHLLRHCFARHLLDNNTSLVLVSEALGHRSLNSTERYIHINKERMLDAYNKFAPKNV